MYLYYVVLMQQATSTLHNINIYLNLMYNLLNNKIIKIKIIIIIIQVACLSFGIYIRGFLPIKNGWNLKICVGKCSKLLSFLLETSSVVSLQVTQTSSVSSLQAIPRTNVVSYTTSYGKMQLSYVAQLLVTSYCPSLLIPK